MKTELVSELLYKFEKLAVPKVRPLADFLPTLTIKAKDFATELTSHNVIDKDLAGEASISDEHVENNRAVRRLPAAEDVSKVKRKLESETKKILKKAKKLS